jgi:S-methylmethionine-dependent homocysteine/selenocysteine methylase
MTHAPLKSRLNRGELIVLDGALGTELLRRGVKTPLPLWSAQALLDAPDTVRAIHEDYIRAGADILTVDTFRTTSRALGKVGRSGEADRLTERAVTLAREAAENARGGREILLAGALAPLEDCYRPELMPDATTAEKEHAEQAVRLVRRGVDLILIETMNSTAEAKAALRGAKPTGVPVLVSFLCRSARELWNGESLAGAVQAVEALKPDAILVNCVSPDVAGECVAEMARVTRIPLGCYPNAGEPDMESGTWRFDPRWTPEKFAEAAGGWVARGAQIVGGCCGTNPEHIRALKVALPPVLVE